tara:strand:+ start:1355 stop:1570 length:216 start_codon:yes stop_codon:yes gene_type:complete
MDNIKEKLILFFLVVNALFWGLFPHSTHCQVFDYLNQVTQLSFNCPSHKTHLFMGFIFYLLAVYYTQRDHF